MKRMLVAILLSLSLGLAAHQDAKADYSVTYPETSWAMVQTLSGGRLAFIFFDYYGDIFTTHSYTNASPALASLGGGPSALAYYLTFTYYSGPYTCYRASGTTGYSWFYIGVYCL